MTDDPPHMMDPINYVMLFSSFPLFKSFHVAIPSTAILVRFAGGARAGATNQYLDSARGRLFLPGVTMPQGVRTPIPYSGQVWGTFSDGLPSYQDFCFCESGTSVSAPIWPPCQGLKGWPLAGSCGGPRQEVAEPHGRTGVTVLLSSVARNFDGSQFDILNLQRLL